MAKFALLVEYEGTRYNGFQIQPGAPTIQGELERALQRLTGEKIRVMGASRTDAGVHAKGQVVAFNGELSLPPETIVRALNFHLPFDIAIQACLQVADDFNPRRQAISREYRYTILNSSTPSPLTRRHAYLVFQPLNVEAMNRACYILTGKHDFAPFTTTSFAGRNTTRTVFQTNVHREGKLVFFHIMADSFLPQQVRRTVGTLIKVGLGQMTVEDFEGLARSKTLGLAVPSAPPWGLCLMKIEYPDLEFEIG